MSDLYRDAQKALLSLIAGPVAGFVVTLAIVGGYWWGHRGAQRNVAIIAARDTVRLRDSVRVVVRDTVTIYRKRVDTVHAVSNSLDVQVVVVNDSTVRVSDAYSEKYDTIPPLVIADLRALRLTVATQDTLLRWWARKSATDSLAIGARDRLISLQRPSRCSRKCGLLIGLTAGLAFHKFVK